MIELVKDEYWSVISERLAILKELDGDCALVFGSNRHNYKLKPAASESIIVEYENRLNISLHPFYRSYLKYFSLGGAGPGYGIYGFPDRTGQTGLGLSNPLVLKPFDQDSLPAYWEEKTESLKREDGLIAIGTTGNPSTIYFIQSGKFAGNVILVSEDIIIYYGAFHDWYSNWIETSIKEIKNIPLINRIEIGMSYDELISTVGLPYEMPSDEYIEFDGLPAHVLLDKTKNVRHIQARKCGEP